MEKWTLIAFGMVFSGSAVPLHCYAMLAGLLLGLARPTLEQAERLEARASREIKAKD